MKTLIERIEALEQQLLPIGTIIQAFLSEPQLQKQMGAGWVLCDGRSVVGSNYHQLGIGGNVPDCRGRFLRTFGPHTSSLGSTQEEGTAVNGLEVATAKLSDVSGKPNFQVNWDGAGDWDDERSPDFHNGWKRVTVVQDATGVKSRVDIGSVGEPFVTQFAETVHTHDITVRLGSSDTETRPKNISVNTFVKVN